MVFRVLDLNKLDDAAEGGSSVTVTLEVSEPFSDSNSPSLPIKSLA
jgi:hypothetical protein